MNKNSYWNKGATIPIAISIITVLVMLPGALGQYEDEATGDRDDEGFVPMSDQTGMVGSWNLNLTDQEIRHLNLTLGKVDKYLFGPGILVLNNISRQATAVGWSEGGYYLLYVVTSDGAEMIEIQLTEERGLISGGYKAYYADICLSTGEVYGSRIVEKIETQGPSFGVSPDELKNAINDSKGKYMHENENVGSNDSGDDDSGKGNSKKETSAHPNDYGLLEVNSRIISLA